MTQNNLITVKLDRGDFEYDIHSLVKAFYPQCEVKVSADELPPEAMLRMTVSGPRRTCAIRNTAARSCLWGSGGTECPGVSRLKRSSAVPANVTAAMAASQNQKICTNLSP